MRNIKIPLLVLVIISFGTCTFGQVWKQYADSGKVLTEQKKMDKAIEFYSKAREELKKDSLGTIHYAVACIDLANLYKDMQQYDKAEPLFLEAKEIRVTVSGREHADYASTCNSLGVLYSNTGQYEKADTLLMEAREIRGKILGKEDPKYAATCVNLATLYDYMGQYDKAETLFVEAKQVLAKMPGKDSPDYAKCCNNLGILYYEMGRYDKAEPLYLEVMEIYKKAQRTEDRQYAATGNNLATLYLDMGQYEKAEVLYREVMEMYEKAGRKHSPDYADACGNLGNLYMEMEQFAKAEPLYVEAMKIYEKVFGKEHPEFIGTSGNLALVYQKMGRYKQAERLHLQTMQIKEKVLGKEHPEYAQSCKNLADLYTEARQYAKAEPLYLEAKHVREKTLGKQHPLYGSTCENLAMLYWALHQPLRAEMEFKEAFSVNAGNVFSVFEFTNEKEKTEFIKNKSGEDDKAYSFYASEKLKSEQPYSLSLFHRNLILSSSQALKKQLFSINDTAIVSKYNDWLNLKKDLSALYSMPVSERKEDVAEIEEKAGKLEKELARASSDFKKQQQKVDWKDIRNKLKADEASIEFASFHFDRAYEGVKHADTVLYVASVLRKDSVLPATIFLFNEKQLVNLLSSIRNNSITGINALYAMKGAAGTNDLITGKSIYKLIWQPLEKELKGIKTIYFAPAGMLHKIAFAALPVTKKEVLSDRYKLVQLASTASVADQQPSFVSPSDKIQLYGGISYRSDTTQLKNAVLSFHHEKAVNYYLPTAFTRNAGLKDLPGTKKEIETISFLAENKTNITTLTGINATEESIKALDGKASPAVLHIATHGFFFPDPKREEKDDLLQRSTETAAVFKLSDDPLMRSALLFAGASQAWENKPLEGIDDGVLTAYEVSNLYLPNTKLVVLSACETGLGDIEGSEGVYGLQRAFKIAGAENLIMSLWKVADLETAEFMQLFYKSLFANQSINDAFDTAQEEMKNKYRLQPYKWAAWVLVR